MSESSEAAPQPLDRAHLYARERGVSPRLYRCVRGLARLLLRLWFRVRISGAEYVPTEGPTIVAPNHKSFLDAFFIGIAVRRHVRYMAKSELFVGPLGWLFSRLGAFPVRRGRTDADAMQTARTILASGGLVVLFPEGTRVDDSDALGAPHHGAGRLALETHAPIVPAAITGTSHLPRAVLPRLRRVQVAFLPAVQAAAVDTPQAALALIDEQVWPAVRDEYGRLLARPGVIAVAVAALGIGGAAFARGKQAASRRPRLLGIVEPRKLRRRKARHDLVARLRSRL